jgi:hypothetical protein
VTTSPDGSGGTEVYLNGALTVVLQNASVDPAAVVLQGYPKTLPIPVPTP